MIAAFSGVKGSSTSIMIVVSSVNSGTETSFKKCIK